MWKKCGSNLEISINTNIEAGLSMTNDNNDLKEVGGDDDIQWQ